MSNFKQKELNDLVKDEKVSVEEIEKVSVKGIPQTNVLEQIEKRRRWRDLKRKFRKKGWGELKCCGGCPYVEKTKAFLGTGEIIESPKHSIGVEDKSPELKSEGRN